ncbi:hypothetical protein [Anditalea andensis]|uniref:Uncharacterized protein n=1 Tax=Anditalea andensis TaxID=1048983 RepID=A0A074L0X0_9BACT|nr:hypothetical protein [Anditalea andensis]KEO75891.1 hypothetical protein EL17_23015 [Anditalea andensis]
MIEVFCTNIPSSEVADRILAMIGELYPDYKANFDLEDCDKILRVEGKGVLEVDSIMDLVICRGYTISILQHIIQPA